MANDGKFLNIDSTTGLPKQEQAINSSAGAGDADKIVRLGAGGKLDATLMPVGIGSEARTLVASEALSAGDLVNFHNNAGTTNMRKADGSAAGKPADGYVLAAVVALASGTVFPEEGVVSGLSGFTPGVDVFLSVATPGLITATVPTGAGKVAQSVGKAISATEVLFRRGVPYTLA